MIVNCEFEDVIQKDCITSYYMCLVKGKNIPAGEKCLKFNGIHLSEKSDDDVQKLTFQSCVIPQIPQGIGDNFKNIKVLILRKAGLKSITKFDLRQFTNLIHLDLCDNALESLPADLFEFTKIIEKIYFSDNKIKFIGSALLDDLPNLKMAYFSANDSIDYFFNEGYERSGRFTLKMLKELIQKDCKPPSELSDCSRGTDEASATVTQTHSLDETTDFTIIVDNHGFKIHKFILVARSETIAKFIKENPDATKLIFRNISIDAFKRLLKFIYTNNVDLKPNDYEIFESACILKIQSLINLTAKFMRFSSNKSEKNLEVLFKFFEGAGKCEQGEWKLKAFEEIKKHFPGRTLANELADQPENLKKIIDAKLVLDQL